MVAAELRLSQSTPAGICTCNGPVPAPPVLVMSKLTVFWAPRNMPEIRKPGLATNCGTSGLTLSDKAANVATPSSLAMRIDALPFKATALASALKV